MSRELEKTRSDKAYNPRGNLGEMWLDSQIAPGPTLDEHLQGVVLGLESGKLERIGFSDHKIKGLKRNVAKNIHMLRGSPEFVYSYNLLILVDLFALTRATGKVPGEHVAKYQEMLEHHGIEAPRGYVL